MEAYTRWQADAPWSVLAKSGLLSQRERLPTKSLVYILLTTLGLFGKLVAPQSNVFSLIGREAMKESKFYQEIQEEGRVEGRLETRRADIHETLEVRFGSEVAAEFDEVLQGLSDWDELTRLLREAIRCRRPAEFRRLLPRQGQPN